MGKYLLVVVFILTGWCTGGAWEATRVDTIEARYPEGQLKEQFVQVFWAGNDTIKKTGFYRSWFSNRQIESEGCYDHDLKIGTWVRWDSTGRRVEEVTYLDGEKHGSEIEWNTDGTLRKWLHYREGRLHGRRTWLKTGYGVNGMYNNPDLTLETDQFFVDGSFVAPLTTVAHRDGGLPGCGLREPYYNKELDIWVEQPWRTREYHIGKKEEGKKTGIWTVWAEDGSMLGRENYERGESR